MAYSALWKTRTPYLLDSLFGAVPGAGRLIHRGKGGDAMHPREPHFPQQHDSAPDETPTVAS
ncbi:MAG TPA: hypothetical protein VFS83_08260, partial [Ktedonobacterales bacterium]|nr:hypothetical protein [Ktedonobacterales bacterium]